jgi:hypothetical protein
MTNLPAKQNANQLAVVGANYVELAVRQVMRDFLEINEGLDLDFVRMGDYIRINKKGKFYDSADESNVFGDHIDVVIIQGEQRYTLWGNEDSPEKGQLVVSHKDEATARAALDEWLQANPDAQQRYSLEDLELRYIAWVVPVTTIGPENPPQIYLLSLPTTATIAWGKYALNIVQGRYRTLHVPARTSAKHVVTRVSTEDAKSRRDQSISYLAIKFECLGMFKPEDYGIDPSTIDTEITGVSEEGKVQTEAKTEEAAE